jgi:hypothetical protein
MRLVFWMIILVGLVAACGEGDKVEPTRTRVGVTGDEGEFARSMLLTRSDFPDGWVHRAPVAEEQAEPEPGDPFHACDPEIPGQTGEAFGGEYSDENTTLLSINPTVHVFETEEHAEQAVDLIVGQARCFAEAIGEGMDVDDEFAFGPTTFEELSAEEFNATAAYRLAGTQIYKSLNETDALVFDSVLILDGRVVYELDGFQRHTPIDHELLRTYVEKARAKIRQEP